MMRNELRCAAARCVVLMIEHEWPQNWPELFDQLEDVSFYYPQETHFEFSCWI